MPSYDSQFVADFVSGYQTAKEPWLSMSDAFPTLYDARVEQGVLKKRDGYTELADTCAGYPIMGVHPTMQYGKPTVLVCDTKRCYHYDPWTETLTDLFGSDTFTGTDRDFFWFQDWRDKCYFCNGVDSIYIYDEEADTQLAALNTVGDADTDVAIDSAQMIFRAKSRLIFIGPTVAGRRYPRRAYYTDINLTTVASTNYVNGDIEDVPVAGCYINNEPTVFCHEGFIAKIAYTRNTEAPFSWESMWQGQGSLGPSPAPTYNRRALQVGHDHLFWWDGYQVALADLPIRGQVARMSNFYASYLQAAVRRDKPILYLTYANDGSSSCDRLLEYNLDEGNFALHKISLHCLYGTTGHVTTSIADLDDLLGDDGDTEIVYSDLDIIRHPTYGAMLYGGGHTGKLYLLNYGTTDDGTDIDSEVWSVPFNPYSKEGRKVKLGDVKILVTTDASKSCTFSIYKDLSTTAFKTATLDASGTGDKHWVTLHGDGEVGNFFRLSFIGDVPQVHAVLLKTARAGALDAGGAESEITIDAASGNATTWRFIQDTDGNLQLQEYVSGSWTKYSLWGDH